MAGSDTVGTRITALRRARGWTQERLAAATGVSRSAVAQWETDRAGQERGNLARIARALGVTLDMLLHGDGGADGAKGDELALLRLYRECSSEARAELLRQARRLSGGQGPDGPAQREQDAS